MKAKDFDDSVSEMSQSYSNASNSQRNFYKPNLQVSAKQSK